MSVYLFIMISVGHFDTLFPSLHNGRNSEAYNGIVRLRGVFELNAAQAVIAAVFGAEVW